MAKLNMAVGFELLQHRQEWVFPGSYVGTETDQIRTDIVDIIFIFIFVFEYGVRYE